MLTERQRIILRTVVEDYVKNAEPVGSRTLSKHGSLQLSPATLRNEMSDLEEMGYLEQPHTSAGRVPSQKGYRFYVDHLLAPSQVIRSEVDALKRLFREKMDELERVVQQTAQILSSLTNYTAVVLGPRMHEATLRHLQLISLSESSAVVIMVTDSGHVESKTITLPAGMPIREVERLVEQLNRALAGVPFTRIRSRLHGEIMLELARSMERYEDAVQIIDQWLQRTPDPDERVYVDGATRILSQPEFRDVEKVRPLLDLLGQSDSLLHVVTNRLSPSGLEVRIGNENNRSSLEDCSLVTTTYGLHGRPVGLIGVLGPKRMEYSKVVGVLDYLSGALTELLERLYGDG